MGSQHGVEQRQLGQPSRVWGGGGWGVRPLGQRHDDGGAEVKVAMAGCRRHYVLEGTQAQFAGYCRY